MNRVAAVKAVGVWLAVVAVLGAWIGGIAWALVSGQSESVVTVVSLSPLLLAVVACGVFLLIWAPLRAMYDHFDREGR